jgi:hypothetical protein
MSAADRLIGEAQADGPPRAIEAIPPASGSDRRLSPEPHGAAVRWAGHATQRGEPKTCWCNSLMSGLDECASV